MLKHLRTILILGRMSNLPTAWTNVMAAWFLAGGDWCGELWWMMAGVSLLYVGGMTWNDAFDVEWDSKHAVDRPIPAGVIAARTVWVLGGIQMVLGVGLILFFTSAAWYYLLALVLAIVIYDWSHKHWKGGAWLMGSCRFLVYIVVASGVVAGGARIPADVCLFAGALFFYIVGIAIAARGESIGGRVGWYAKSFLLTPVVLGLAVMMIDRQQGLDAVLAASVMLVLCVVFALRQLQSGRPDRIGRFVSVLLAGIVLVDFIVLAQFGAIFWPVCGGLLVVTRLAQRWIPAT